MNFLTFKFNPSPDSLFYPLQETQALYSLCLSDYFHPDDSHILNSSPPFPVRDTKELYLLIFPLVKYEFLKLNLSKTQTPYLPLSPSPAPLSGSSCGALCLG
jgi:hypothetical protein